MPIRINSSDGKEKFIKNSRNYTIDNMIHRTTSEFPIENTNIVINFKPKLEHPSAWKHHQSTQSHFEDLAETPVRNIQTARIGNRRKTRRNISSGYS